MKHLAKLIYNLFYWIDVKFNLIEEYDYETAPYCGHHFNGHKGKFTHSDFHEGMGGMGLNTKNPFLKIYWHDEEKWNWYPPCIRTRQYVDYKGETIGKPRDFYGLKGYLNCHKITKNARLAGMNVKLKYSIA